MGGEWGKNPRGPHRNWFSLEPTDGDLARPGGRVDMRKREEEAGDNSQRRNQGPGLNLGGGGRTTGREVRPKKMCRERGVGIRSPLHRYLDFV